MKAYVLWGFLDYSDGPRNSDVIGVYASLDDAKARWDQEINSPKSHPFEFRWDYCEIAVHDMTIGSYIDCVSKL